MLIPVTLKPETRQLRQFGIGGLVVSLALAGLALWRGSLLGFDLGEHAPVWAGSLAGAGALLGILGTVAPRLNLPFYVALTMITLPIGIVFSFVIMAVIFYLIITPMGLVFRVLGRDALCETLESERDSYWQPIAGEAPVERYFRQF